MLLSRRDLMKWGTTAAALWTAHTAVGAESQQKREALAKPRIGLQLYSVCKECEKDLPGVLEAVAKMGYEGVEFAGYYGRQAEELKKLLDENKLRCCGTHIALNALLGDELQETIAFNKTLDNPYLIVSYMGADRLGTIEKVEKTAKLFTDLSEKVRSDGMWVGYHAHGGDFKKLGDQTIWEIFFSRVGPDVLMQLDIGNCIGGGGDPYAMLKKFPGRSVTIHLKEHGGKPGAPIGEGEVKWTEVLQLCESTGNTRWYIVEQEAYDAAPLESVKKCIDNLKKIGK